MTFEEALKAMKEGERVTLPGYFPLDYLYYQPSDGRHSSKICFSGSESLLNGYMVASNDWEIVRHNKEEGLTLNQIVDRLKNGQTIRKKSWMLNHRMKLIDDIVYSPHGSIEEFYDKYSSICSLTSNDWEVVD